ENGIIDWTVAKAKKDIDGCGVRDVVVVYSTYNKENESFAETDTPFPFPAPTLIVKPKQLVRVLIRNMLGEPTTFHWHGLLMQKACFADGSESVTQCPIKEGENFLYEFKANDKPAQRVDGLYGYIIIEDDDNKCYDEDLDSDNAENPCPYCVLISDWYNVWANTLLNAYRYCNYSPKIAAEPVPHSIVINGKGAGNCLGCTPKNSVVAPEVIEVEGMRVKDSYKNHTKLPLSVGQRYSVIASTDETDTVNFWMRIQTSTDCIRDNTHSDQKAMLVKEIKAIVRYDKESVDDPTTDAWVNLDEEGSEGDLPCTDFDYGLLSPEDDSNAPEPEQDEDKKDYFFGIYMSTTNSTKNPYTTYGSVSLITDAGQSVISGRSVIYDDSSLDSTENTLQFTMENQ
ncbi:17056_t:CDS:2, partial [Racocetra fulgida]